MGKNGSMNGRKPLRIGCLLSLLLIVGVMVVLPCLMVWRAMRQERLSGQLLTTIKRVMYRWEPYYLEAEKVEQEQTKQQNLRDEATVMRLLREGADPNVRDFPVRKRTLWEDVRFQLKRILRPPPASATLPQSALALAVQADDTAIVTALLKAGANDVNGHVDFGQGVGSSPLVNYAALVGNLEILRALCAHGADIHQRGLFQGTPNASILQSALGNDCDYTDTMILDTNGTIRRKGKVRIEIFRLLLTLGAKYDPESAEGVSLLDAATKEDYLEVVQQLLAAGVPAHIEGDPADGDADYTPLDNAVATDDIALVRLLLRYGASVREKGAEPPILLARSANMAQLLLEHGADIHAGSKMRKHAGENALSYASMRGDKPLISFLLAHGFDVNSHGYPIMEAALYADVATVRLLLLRGAKVGPNSPGEGALWLAIASHHSDSAQLLLKYGAAVNVKGEDPPLVEAAHQDDLEVARELLERGADANAGRGAALLAACESCDEDLVEMLLEHGADPTIRSEDGTTAIQAAKASADPPEDAGGIIALLKKYGAKR